jgi:pyruvate dehydrogenase E1 component alpha subunit
VHAVRDAAERAVAAIRGGSGPIFLELRTYRFRAHSMYDPDLYRDKAEVADWKEHHDPIDGWISRLRAWGLAGDDDVAAIEADAQAEIDAAVEFAEGSEPEPVEELTRFVYAEGAAP